MSGEAKRGRTGLSSSRPPHALSKLPRLSNRVSRLACSRTVRTDVGEPAALPKLEPLLLLVSRRGDPIPRVPRLDLLWLRWTQLLSGGDGANPRLDREREFERVRGRDSCVRSGNAPEDSEVARGGTPAAERSTERRTSKSSWPLPEDISRR